MSKVRWADIGDLFMSLIRTCELNDVNPFEYLTLLQRYSAEVKENPAGWMPWKCRERLLHLASTPT